MEKLEMEGPFILSEFEIDNLVEVNKIGNYVLCLLEDKTFVIKYVGRSDNDLNDRLKKHLEENYTLFMFSYASSIQDAYEKECQNYHDFGGSDKLDNKIHPAKPEGINCICPKCRQ